MKIDIFRDCPIDETVRVTQVAGMFDVPIGERSSVAITGELPIEDRPWNVGFIVGPSGAGKSTVARHLFGDRVVTGYDWPENQSILDGFPDDLGIKELTGLLNKVGFGSVPNWFRPFRVLSNGEQFRATVARALASNRDLIAIDEFTSVVDRQVAKIASNCVQKTVRRTKRQFVAIACHYDIVEWLQPDWVYEPHLGAFEWRSVQRRPDIAIEIRSVDKSIWHRFSKYHYLSATLAPAAICIGAFINGHCVGFTSAIPFPHPTVRNLYMAHRTVVLPDYQGLGLGATMSEWLGLYLWQHGWRLNACMAHPAMIAQRAASPRWRLLRSGVMKKTLSSSKMPGHIAEFTTRRATVSFEYIAPAGTISSPYPLRTGPVLGVRNQSLRHKTNKRHAARAA